MKSMRYFGLVLTVIGFGSMIHMERIRDFVFSPVADVIMMFVGCILLYISWCMED